LGRIEVSSQRLNQRFYKSVTIEDKEGEWRVLLDGMQLRTPGKLKLAVSSKVVAEKIAAEWDAQTKIINPSIMPVTRLVNVAIEQTPERRPDLVAEARRYAQTDLLCYRAPEPRILKERQSAAWDKWLEWGGERAVVLETTESLHAIQQPKQSLERIDSYATSLNDLGLTLFVHLIAVYGSVILALAVMEQVLSAANAFDLSRLDAIYQIELWGEDEEQAEITASLKQETKILGGLVPNL